ncbi:MAG: PAS domain-containing protein [Candidatus Gracilibacteria bacterium]|jgi:PAS domain S-box-containing protein
MIKLNQSHKIAISVAAIFMVSLSIMLFLLSGGNQNLGHLQANVQHAGSAGEGSAEGNLNSKILEKYKSYFKDPSEIIFSVDSEGKFKYASDGFCELIDIDCTLAPGKLFFDYVHSNDLADLASKHSKMIREEKDVDGIGPYRLYHKNSKGESLVMFNVHIILDNDKKPSEIVFSVKDITKKVDEMRVVKPEPENNSPKVFEVIPEPFTPKLDEEDEKDTPRPGDTRMMVEKISFASAE